MNWFQDVRVGTSQSILQVPTEKDNVAEGCLGVDHCAQKDKCPVHSTCEPEWEQYNCQCDSGKILLHCNDLTVYSFISFLHYILIY